MNVGSLPYGLFIPTFVRRAKSGSGEGMRTLRDGQNFMPRFFPQWRKRLW